MSQNLSWQINPVTGDYILDDTGSPVVSSDLTTPAYIRLSTQRTRWLYAPDSTYGSDYYLMQKRQVSGDASLAETVAQRALQPIVDDGRASSVSVGLVGQANGDINLSVIIVDSQGQPQVISLDEIGN